MLTLRKFWHIINFSLICLILISCENEKNTKQEQEKNIFNLNTSKDSSISQSVNEKILCDFNSISIKTPYTSEQSELNNYTEDAEFLGWSEDGKLACLLTEMSGIGMADGNTVNIVLHNLNNDKQRVIKSYTNGMEQDGATNFETIKDLLNIKRNEILKILKRNRITPCKIDLNNMAFIESFNNHISFEVVENKKNEETDGKVTATFKNGKSKTIFKYHFPDRNLGVFGVYSVNYLGYLINNQKNKALIVGIKKSREIEGAIVHGPLFIGCDLEK